MDFLESGFADAGINLNYALGRGLTAMATFGMR